MSNPVHSIWDEALGNMRRGVVVAVQMDPANGMPLQPFAMQPNWDIATVDLEVTGIQYNPAWATVSGTRTIGEALVQLTKDYFLTNPRFGMLHSSGDRLTSRSYHDHRVESTQQVIDRLFA